jgi:hypothetical protein
MNYHSLSLWANSHKVIVIEPQQRIVPKHLWCLPQNIHFLFKHTNFTSYYLQYNEQAKSTNKVINHQTHVQKLPNVSMSFNGPLNNLKNFIWFTFNHHGLMKQRHDNNNMPTQYVKVVKKFSSEWSGFKINQCWQILSSSICISSISKQ